ncbi:MAG TPA: DoxX family protein [Thermoanaerobaculia bacterium]|nr:DoxX family protein [Thermoanaerobaculia bacterium]
MANKLLATDDGWAGLLLRLTLGLVILPHGAQKLLGWFGGGGFQGTLQGFEANFGLPAFVTVLVIVAEFFGSIGLVVGFLTRLCAAGIAAVMLGALFMVHLPNGFFMNWMGTQQGEGYEFHLLAIGIALTLMVVGGGKASVDRAMSRR